MRNQPLLFTMVTIYYIVYSDETEAVVSLTKLRCPVVTKVSNKELSVLTKQRDLVNIIMSIEELKSKLDAALEAAHPPSGLHPMPTSSKTTLHNHLTIKSNQPSNKRSFRPDFYRSSTSKNQSLNSRKSTVPKKNLNVINNIVDREIKRQRRSRNDRDDEYGVISEKDDFDSS